MRYFFFLGALLGLASCNSNKDAALKVIEYQFDATSDSPLFLLSREPGIIPADLSFHEILVNPEKYSWKDLDTWYRQELPYHLGKDYFRNLEQALFSGLIKTFHLDQKADLQTVQYYVMRQLESGRLAAPDLYVRCLKRLENATIPVGHLYLYAENAYQLGMNELAGMSNKDMIAVFEPRYQSLKTYIDELKEKYNITDHKTSIK